MPFPRPILHKLFYSKLHLEHLYSLVERYLETAPDGVVIDKDDASNDPRVSISPDEVPSSIRLLAGDILQNVRSVLDYLVWELVLAAKGKPTKHNTFPVCTCSDSFKEALRGKGNRLAGVPDDAITIIESLQPYHFGVGNEDRSALFALDQLTNINKHRSILLTRSRLAPLDFMSVFDASGAVIGYDPTLAMDDDANARFIAEAIKMKVNKQLALFVQFDEGAARGLEACGCLQGLMNFVGLDVLRQFERFFA